MTAHFAIVPSRQLWAADLLDIRRVGLNPAPLPIVASMPVAGVTLIGVLLGRDKDEMFWTGVVVIGLLS